MIFKKSYAWVAAAIALIATLSFLGLGLWWNITPNVAIDQIAAETCDRIQLGMTEAQVRKIIGRPPDKEFHPWDYFAFLPAKAGENVEWEKLWFGTDRAIIVDFDANGNVCNKGFSLQWE